MKKRTVYLDYAAATPLDERVVSVMEPYFIYSFYNPAAAYLAARAVRADIQSARFRVANILGAKTAEIIFTAGATESINLALFGVLNTDADARLVTNAAEHEAVLSVARSTKGTVVPVLSTGLVDLSVLAAAITDETAVVSMSYINNELGCVQPIRDISKLVALINKDRRYRGEVRELNLHVDASQAVGHLDMHVSRLGVDLLTLNAAKAYGPKQVGVLYVRSGIMLKPLVEGGGQESGLRSGTENVSGIIGAAEAIILSEASRASTLRHLSSLHALAVSELQRAIPDMIVNGHHKRFSPHILSVSFAGVDGERLLMELDERGIMVATGSACAASRDTKSHVLAAINLSDDLIAGSLRLSFGHQTTEEDVRYAVSNIIECVVKQRSAHD